MAKMIPIILAGGMSTRMKSEIPKPLHHILGRPMIFYLLESLNGAGLQPPIVVTGHKGDILK